METKLTTIILVGLAGVLVIAISQSSAHIENALVTNPYEIDFGTVLPQEYLEKNIKIALSDSFIKEESVNSVEYKIIRKLKCKVWEGSECKEYYNDLCPFLSQFSDYTPDNDEDVPSYYDPQGCLDTTQSQAWGYLNKAQGDYEDNWTIDLYVPSIAGFQAQNWPENCPTIPEEGDYACDFWVEVKDINSGGITKIYNFLPIKIAQAYEAHVINITAQICDYSEIRTVGYWKTHSGIYSFYLPQKLGDEYISSADETDEIFNNASSQEIIDQLKAQLLAMKFNIIHSDIGKYVVESEGKTLNGITIEADLLLQDSETTREELEEITGLLGYLNNLHQIEYCSNGNQEPEPYCGDGNIDDGEECPSGMVSYWKFDEGSGIIARDSADTNDGTLINNPAWVNGMVGKALSFNGMDNSVEIPDSPSLNSTNAITVETWINPKTFAPTNDGLGDAVVGKWRDDEPIDSTVSIINHRQYLIHRYGTKIRFHISRNGFDIPWAESQSDIPLDQWTHVAGTYDGQNIRIYVNGVLEGTTPLVGTIAAFSDPAYIGGYQLSPIKERFYDGSIDEVAIFNRALSAEEIDQHYQNGLIGLGYFPLENQPPTCVIKLQKDGVEINEINIGEFFDIYAGDSTDDTGIKEVRFSSDDIQDDNPIGGWTDWYNWNTSLGDWNSINKIMAWSFTTDGDKEVWAEVKDDIGQTSNCSSNIFAIPEKSTKFNPGDSIIIESYTSLYKEPRITSESFVLYESKCGKIIENENNGIFADGHFWWYVEELFYDGWVIEGRIEKNQPPKPLFNYAPRDPKVREEIIFDASESEDPDGEIIFYRWYLDGKSLAGIENPIMFYVLEKQGAFNLKLEISDNCLSSASIEKTIEVEGKAKPEKIKKIIKGSDIIKIADDLGIPHYTEDCGWWCKNEYFVLNDEKYLLEELLGVLNKPIKKISETGELIFVEDVIYGMEIRNILEDAKLVDLTSRSTWAPKEEDFENLKKTNTWAETILELTKWEAPVLKLLLKNVAFLLELPQLHVAGGLIGPIVTIAEGYRVYKTLDFLEDRLYKRALWHYLQLRIGESDSISAFWNSPIPAEYCPCCNPRLDPRPYPECFVECSQEGQKKCNITRESFEELYQTYKPYIIPGEGGLGENFEKIKEDLRKRIYNIMESYSSMPRKFIRIGSVGELRVYDSKGKITGLVNGEIIEEIPYSMYDEENETIIIFPAIDSYFYEISGTDEGTYGLIIISVENGETTAFTATDIPTAAESIHQYTIDWDALSQNEEGVTLQIDADGDGIFEQTVTADNDFTHDEFILQTETIIDFDPDTLNLKDEGKFVTVYIELPEGYEISQIDISSIMLNGFVPALSKPIEIDDYDGDGTSDLMVKFDRSEIQAILSPREEVTLILTGKVFHNGNHIDFQGSDVISVIDPGEGKT